MKTIVKLNKVGLDKIAHNQQKSLIMAAEATKTDLIMSQTMPFGDSDKNDKHIGGTLQNDSTFVETKYARNGKVYILSDTPYARRLYFHPEYNFRKDDNPNAGGRWYDTYINGEKQRFTINVYNKMLKRLNGG